MGLLTWVTANGRKSGAAALIQQFFEMRKDQGEFAGDPAKTAAGLVQLACNRVPALPDSQKGFVLAASVLSIIVMENEIPLNTRDEFATALAAMLRAAKEQRHMHSYEDQRVLEFAQGVYAGFREQVPSPRYVPPTETIVPNRELEPEIASESDSQTVQERARAMDDLIKRMQV